MKKTGLILFLFFLSCIAYAQPESKNAYWRGNASFRLSSTEGTGTFNPTQTSTSFHIAPAFGFCLNEKIVIGIGLRYASNISKNPGSKFVNIAYSSELFLKYYIPLTDNKKVFFSPELRLETGDAQSKSITAIKTSKTGDNQFFTAGVYGSFSYYPNHRLGLEMNFGSLFYRRDIINSPPTSPPRNADTFNFEVNPAYISLGLSYLIK